MISQDFHLDFHRQTITHRGQAKTIYSVLELYSYLQDIFDEPENMKYAIPIVAESPEEFTLVNGWTMDPTSRQFLSGHLHERTL